MGSVKLEINANSHINRDIMKRIDMTV
jgi:hypothetical protein